MSESSGGQALKVRSTSENQIEVRLLFKSTAYILPQLTSRLQDVEAFMKLLLLGKTVLNPGRPISKKQQAALVELVEKTDSGHKTAQRHLNSQLGFELQDHALDSR